MTVFIAAAGWFDADSQISFEVADLDMAQEIVDSILANGANVRNAVVYDVVSVSKEPEIALDFHGCRMCGNDWKSLNSEGFCSSCYQVWKG